MAQVLPALSNSNAAAIMMSVMVLLPIPLMAFFVYRVMTGEWEQYNKDNEQRMKEAIEQHEHAHVASGSVVDSVTIPVNGAVEMQTTGTCASTMERHEGDGVIAQENGDGNRDEEDMFETDIDLEMSSIHDMIPDIVDLVYEGDGQETNGIHVYHHEEIMY